MDVLEIDAATHTGVDHVRDVIIDGLGIRPVRDRYKIFIIDEVHQLSSSSFNALLKSIEEPPPHVVFMMATTELNKIPDTITSRSQVYEFKTIALGEIVEQLRSIATSEGVAVEDAALALVARAAEGSMRDAQSAFDQVIAFAGESVTAEDVRAVLGLVGRDVLLEIVDMVADENAGLVFDVAGRLVESGQDLRIVCRELARVVRDLMVIAIDPARTKDTDLVLEGDVDRLGALAGKFSREDLLRSFDVLSRAENEIRYASQPRYHFEMALLRWIHTRKLTPLSELIQSMHTGTPFSLPPTARAAASAAGAGTGAGVGAPTASSRFAAKVERRVEAATARDAAAAAAGEAPRPAAAGLPPAAIAPELPSTTLPEEHDDEPPHPAGASAAAPPSAAAVQNGAPPTATLAPSSPGGATMARARAAAAGSARPKASAPAVPADPPDANVPRVELTEPHFRETFLSEIKKSKKFFHGTVIAQARRIDIGPDGITVVFSSAHAALRTQFEQNRAMLETLARAMSGRFVRITSEEDASAATAERRPVVDEKAEALKQRALGEAAVQAMLDVFPAEIRDVEEIDRGN